MDLILLTLLWASCGWENVSDLPISEFKPPYDFGQLLLTRSSAASPGYRHEIIRRLLSCLHQGAGA